MTELTARRPTKSALSSFISGLGVTVVLLSLFLFFQIGAEWTAVGVLTGLLVVIIGQLVGIHRALTQ
ncbi:MAG: hypothetical protein Q4G35_04265 [Propionibacteriaceae bacterium]|nr:hypothetical protein [Propionibacteriaceae bacterium]